MNKPLPAAGKVWFREPWPWFLASGPLLVVVASLISAWIAIRSSDGLVSEDYYRQGLAAHETISRSDKAEALGVWARVRLTSDALHVVLAGKSPDFALPPAISITISHPTRAGLDRTERLMRDGDGYSGRLRLPAAGHWLVLIEDESRSWRIMGSVMLPVGGEFAIGESMHSDLHHP